MTDIDPELIKTYRSAIYRVDGPQGVITFYITQHSPELAALHRQSGVQSSAFLTAYHPYSKPASDEENEQAQQNLIQALEAGGYRWLKGKGEDASGAWPGEPSILVLGISEEEATSLASRFKQNGYVFCGSDAVPRLVLTR